MFRVETLHDLEKELGEVDGETPFPHHAMRVPRGKTGGRQKVRLPEGYLDDLDDATPPCAAAEDPASGG